MLVLIRFFLGGANYTYVFQNNTNQNIVEKNCSVLYLENSPDPYPYKYTCFTIDLDYGFLTMFYVFAPGLLLSAFLIYGFWKKQSKSIKEHGSYGKGQSWKIKLKILENFEF